MPEFHASVTIDRPPAVVFAYVADIARWPEWRMAVNSAELVTPGPVGAGTRITVAGSAMGRSMEMEVEITGYDPPDTVAFAMRTGPVTGSGAFRFEPTGAGTRVTVSGSAEPVGALRLAAGLVARQAQAMWADDLAALKGVLEG